jgi:dipeptidyl aminopeptidase/acylaminoacyl peptidase
MNWKTGILIVISLVVALSFLGWQLAPRVESVIPQEGEIHGRQPFQVVFSRAMDRESVQRSLSLTPDYDGKFSWNEDSTILTFTPQNIWPSGDRVSLQISRGPRSRLRFPLLREFRTAWPVKPTSLVYLWPADGDSNLYLLNPESGQTQALTDLEDGVLDYSISPDRQTLYYSATLQKGTSQILSLDLNSGKTDVLLTCSDGACTSPQISTDEDWLAYEFISRSPGTLPGVRVMDLNDGTQLDVGEPDEYLEKPLWSASGWLACYNQTLKGYQFWNPISDEVIFLPNDTGGDGSWSADGRYFLASKIVFVSDNLAPRHLELFDLVERTSRDLSRGSYLEDLNPSFAPQGLRFAFSRKSLNPQDWTPGRQLWVMDLENGDAFALTDEVDYQHTSFAWHPDGNQIAYVRYNQAALSEPPEVWLVSADGENPLRLIINGFAPEWIP